MTAAGEAALQAMSQHFWLDTPAEHLCPECGGDLGHPLHDEFHAVTAWNEGIWASRKAEVQKEFEKREALRQHKQDKEDAKNRPKGLV